MQGQSIERFARPGKAWYPLADEAEFVVDDIEDLARHILEARQSV